MKKSIIRVNSIGIAFSVVIHIMPKKRDVKIVKHRYIHTPAASLQAGEQ
jgi:hypothetical protein